MLQYFPVVDLMTGKVNSASVIHKGKKQKNFALKHCDDDEADLTYTRRQRLCVSHKVSSI